MKKKVFSFGEVLWDILPTATILGGAPFNFAARINTLGDAGYMISRLGQDNLGEKAFQKIVELGLDTSFVQWDENHPTGTVDVSFDEKMNPDYVINPHVAYDFVELTNDLKESIKSADCICFGTLSQRAEKSKQTLYELLECAPSALRFLDINLRKLCYSENTIKYSLEKANILKLNEAEVFEIADMLSVNANTIPDFCSYMTEKWKLEYCLVTLAEKGAFASSAKGEMVYVPGYKINLVDSLGSGDAFSAGFVHQFLAGSTLQQACSFGNVLGAIVATQAGGTHPVSQEQIVGFKEQQPQRLVAPQLSRYLIEN
jgi:fructokinase